MYFKNKLKSLVLISFLFLLAASSAVFAGCGKGKESDFSSTDRSGYAAYDFEMVQAENIESFAIAPNGDMLVSTYDEKLTKYDSHGQEIGELPSEGAFYGNLCYDGETLYAYDYNTSAVVEFTDTEPRVITNSILFHTIRNMVALDGKLYVLAIPFTSDNVETFYSFGMHDFESSGEQVYCIDAAGGAYRTLSLGNVTAEYRSEAGELYFYGWEEDKYYLYKYDTNKNRVAQKLHYDSMDNFLGIVVEGGKLFGTSSHGVFAVDLETGEKEDLTNRWYAMYGNDLQFSKGNLFINSLMQKAVCRAVFFSPDGTLVLQDEEDDILAASGNMNQELAGKTDVQDDKTTETTENSSIQPNINPENGTPAPTPTEFPKREERIAVSTMDRYYLFDDYAVKKISGMRTKWVDITDYDAFVTEMMAGNPDVDIYILGTAFGLTHACKDFGMYEPLNSSEAIKDYLDGCFDYVKDAATLENGDIWMLPIYAYVDTTWYVPENMEHFGLTEQNFDTVDHYLDTLRSLQGKLGNYRYYNYSASFIDYYNQQYDYIFNDYERKYVNYQTDIYRNTMKTLWDGWELYSAYVAEHPLFYSVLNEYGEGSHLTAGEGYDYDTNRVIFKTRNIFEWLRYGDFNKILTGWRIMSAPKITDAAEKQAVTVEYAFVNPYSKQKEAAIAYLEAVVSKPEATMRNPVFFRKGMENYANQYDISLPAFQDLYHISENLDVYYGHGLELKDSMHIVEYQQGLISFDQAIERMQKIMEMPLYE